MSLWAKLKRGNAPKIDSGETLWRYGVEDESRPDEREDNEVSKDMKRWPKKKAEGRPD